MKAKKVYISLPENQCQKIQRLANESFRTRSGYIRRLIAAYLEYIEKYPEQKIT